MARVTVYVPDELKARMVAAGDLVNWSAEAQRAFEVVTSRVEEDRRRRTFRREMALRLTVRLRR